MARVGRVLGVAPGEQGVVGRLLALMFVAWFGVAVGGNAVEGLLLARVGPVALPYLFAALGATTAIVMLATNVIVARGRPHRALLIALAVMAAAVLALRAVLSVGGSWVYPTAWLAMMVLWTAGGIVTWGIAGAVHDTRRAKQLFPLYASGVIAGGAIGGFATAPLARRLAVADLLFVWAAALVAAFVLARSVLRLSGGMGAAARRRRRHPSRIGDGFATVRASPLLSWMSVSTALFALLYFTLTLLFARAASARFPDPGDLAGFLGTFMGAASAMALAASLFVAHRLGARFGIGPTVVALPVIYAAAFVVLTFARTSVALFAFRFVQLVWMQGVWLSAWHALYNVVPAERRQGARAFVEGVALQAGVTCAGALLILAERILSARALTAITLGLALCACAAADRVRRTYGGAVLDALREGNPDVFLTEERPFAGVGRDAAAVAVAAQGAHDHDPAVRRISIEILAEIGGDDVRPALARALTDEDALVRTAALRGLGRLGRDGTIDRVEAAAVARLLEDPDSNVRAAAVEAVDASVDPGGVAALGPLLSDPDARVRARAAARLGESHPAEAADALAAMAESDDPEWRAESIAAWGATEAGDAVAARAVADADPLVRRAAVSALGGRTSGAAVHALIGALKDPDRSIRAQAVDGLVASGRASVGPLLDASKRPEVESEAMRALARLRAVERSVVDDYVARKVRDAVRYADLANALRDDLGPRMELLAYSLRDTARRHAVEALYLASRTGDGRAREVVDTAIDNLDAPEAAQRANALESLEALGERSVVGPLLKVWERDASRHGDEVGIVTELLRDPDAWLRACASFARPDDPRVRAAVQAVADSDPDTLVRSVAADALRAEVEVDSLTSLSLMERIVFLRAVPLFANLSPADLKHVAEVATEQVFGDGARMAEQGEPGDEMHVVVSGAIGVLVSARGAQPVEVAQRGAGECVGEMAVVSRSPRMASLVARGEVRTLALDHRRFERILRERPEASLAVMRVLCDRLRELHGSEPPEAHS